ncbi:MAG TPA: class I SAM-dependent methyltransferase [Cytophagales bacterium]|nr:class I SAM-dependent methyltransferase [Cytophagales bacterium]
MQILTPAHWKDYELLDSGGFEKLEKFGNYILSRPEPQAAWDKSLPEKEWEKLAHASFKKDPKSTEKGQWISKEGMPQNWFLNYKSPEFQLRFKLSLSSFKHVGIFPEQAANWDFIYERTKLFKQEKSKVLNLFAYTGGASLAAALNNADVNHVDSIKQVISWSRENMEANNLNGIRWIVEDALKFAKREVKRGNKYKGIILDPPAYGRGPEGEKWVLEDNINELLKLCKELLDPEEHFLILNLYSLGFSALIVDNLVTTCIGKVTNKEFGELYLEDKFLKKLPLGVFYRFFK